jgi:salicylate 5-hydroxylase small subunit
MAGPAMLDFPTYYALIALHADYAAALDAGEWERWPEFFLDDCVYTLQPRENYDRGLPLATIALESKGMLRDRVYGIRETLFHDPYYQRHVTGLPLIRGVEGDVILTETSYAVFRTKQDQLSEVMNVGRYLDRVQPTAEGLKFAARVCIFDSEMIPNSVIYPI